MSISVVVPVYNSEKSLEPLLERLASVLSACDPEYEVILVNDGSVDKSWQVILKLAKQYSFVRGIDLSRNYGQHNALLCGIRQATKEIIVTLDDDLQNPPEEIPRLLNRLNKGYDVVYGSPERGAHGFLRNIASIITKATLRASMGVEVAVKASAFRAFRAHLREAFADFRSPSLCIDVLLSWATARFSFVTVKLEERQVGVSNYTFGNLIAHAFNMLTGFSALPLTIATWVGFLFAVFGLGVLAYVCLRFVLYGPAVPGFVFLASLISIFSGTQLVILGVFGEYLARVHFRTMDRPVYSVRSTISHNMRT